MIILIFLITIIFYFPILLNPNILVSRGNDLTEFFWPIFYFVKESILKYHQLPFWNNLFFSGTPLLPDPQAPIFYLPNIIFLIFQKIDTGFLISVFLHIFLGGVGIYFLAKLGLNFSKKTSLFCSILYMFSPKLAGFIEAGHFGLIASWAWLPFVFLAVIILAKKPTFKKTIFLAITLAAIFYTHILIFAIAAISINLLFLYLSKNIKYLILANILCFGLIAIALLPQLMWQQDSTRFLLLNGPDVYPKWLGIKEFMKASISPILFGPRFIWNLDTEKTIAIGIFTSIFAFFGFLKLKLKLKFLFILLISLIILISLNNISPIYELLIKQNWYILLRVATRFWFIVIFIFILLAGYGFENLLKIKKIKFLTYILVFLAISELLLTSWTKILKPTKIDINLAPQEIYEFLSSDKDRFRVFCLNRCLSQKESAIYGLQLADGYGTLQQKNYYEYSEQLSQAFYRNRYTLSIPPFEIFEYENLQPYSPNLSAFNIKYIISNHILKDKNLELIKKVNEYLIYKNKINLPRANYPITIYTSNFIQVNSSNYKDEKVVLSEIYNKDWEAYLNGKTKTKIKETEDKTREVQIDNATKFVNFIYEPVSFKIGLIITVCTIISMLYLFHQKQNNSKN